MVEDLSRKVVLVTGGAGFIGSAVVRRLIGSEECTVVNLDRLTYAGNLDSLAGVAADDRHQFVRADVCDGDALRAIFARYQPHAVMHLAAESHVDRSIDGPGAFVRTNLLGTYTLLEETRRYWADLPGVAKERFRLLHVSTDEVYGSLTDQGYFSEDTPYRPNSPYSASKAGSDHLVRAWHHTYALPVVITNCSNNYGPYQFPEKLIPLMILNALEGKPLPVYGKGENVRDWLHVEDHVDALLAVLRYGRAGETYCIGARNERTNLEVVRAICQMTDELAPDPGIGSREQLIRFVSDRPGHDLRYAIDTSKIQRELGWTAERTWDEGLRSTIEWYLSNPTWCDRVRSGTYRGERLGALGGSP